VQILTEICRKLESSLSFSLKKTVTEGTNLRPSNQCPAMNVFFQ